MERIRDRIIAHSPEQLSVNNLYIALKGIIPSELYLKCEGFNGAGSIKLKPALYMIEQMEKEGILTKGCELIESSSGNLGVALSIICAAKGYKFTCVTDPVSTESVRYAIEAAGAKLIVIDQQDVGGGYLQSRIDTIKRMCEHNPNLIWINQYANENNWKAHYHSTASEIHQSFPKIDWLFVGAGTTGTLMGCYHYFKKYSPNTRLIGVDVVGSVTFGKEKSKRSIPGLGTSRRPEIFQHNLIKEKVMVTEKNTIKECRYWAKKGYFFGGSTGTMLSGIRQYADKIKPDDVVVTISPDFGEKYMSTIYNPSWVESKYPNTLDKIELSFTKKDLISV